jgi:hypothetical protein
LLLKERLVHGSAQFGDAQNVVTPPVLSALHVVFHELNFASTMEVGASWQTASRTTTTVPSVAGFAHCSLA